MNDSPWNSDYAVPTDDDDLPLEIGDITSLIIGGPEMVVISTCECGTVEVCWIDSDGDVAVDVFPEEALV